MVSPCFLRRALIWRTNSLFNPSRFKSSVNFVSKNIFFFPATASQETMRLPLGGLPDNHCFTLSSSRINCSTFLETLAKPCDHRAAKGWRTFIFFAARKACPISIISLASDISLSNFSSKNSLWLLGHGSRCTESFGLAFHGFKFWYKCSAKKGVKGAKIFAAVTNTEYRLATASSMSSLLSLLKRSRERLKYKVERSLTKLANGRATRQSSYPSMAPSTPCRVSSRRARIH